MEFNLDSLPLIDAQKQEIYLDNLTPEDSIMLCHLTNEALQIINRFYEEHQYPCDNKNASIEQILAYDGLNKAIKSLLKALNSSYYDSSFPVLDEAELNQYYLWCQSFALEPHASNILPYQGGRPFQA